MAAVYIVTAAILVILCGLAVFMLEPLELIQGGAFAFVAFVLLFVVLAI